MPTTPSTIADAVAYADGTLINSLESVDLPDINLMAEEFEQLGMSGIVTDVSAHVEDMRATLSFKSYHPDDLRAFPPQQAVQLEVRESINDVTEEGVSEFGRIVSMRVIRIGRANDTAERQRTEGPEIEVAVHYLKDQIDGDVITEIDPVNRTLVFDGEDILADRRANLGF